MSIAGVRSNRGDGYQTAVAIEWVVTMILDDKIVAVEVDTTALVGNEPATVDDVVVRYSDNRNLYLQCKKNQKDFEAWSTKELATELVKASSLLRQESTASVTFCSRSNFGLLAKLREHAQSQPNHQSFLKSLTKPLQIEHELLCRYLGGASNSSVETFSLLQRIEFETTGTVERIVHKNRAMLARHITNAEAAHSAIWTAVDQLGARIVRTDGGVHSITRADLQSILQHHDCRPLPAVLGDRPALHQPFIVIGHDALRLPSGTLRALGEQLERVGGPTYTALDDWQLRYEALVRKLEAQEPESSLRKAGQALAGGGYDEAGKHLDAAIQVAKQNADLLGAAYHAKGELHLLKFEQKDALENYRLACHHSPDNADFTSDYGSLLTEFQDFDAAVTVFSSAITRGTDDATAALWYCSLGSALMRLRRLKEAQQMFATSEKLFASAQFASAQHRGDLIHGLYINRGQLYEALDMHDDALRCYRAAVSHFRDAVQATPSAQLDLSLAAALNNLALFYFTSQASDEPGQLYDEARQLLLANDSWKATRDLALVSVNYADYLVARGDYEQAETLLNEALRTRRVALDKSGWHASASYDLCDSLLGLATLHFRLDHTDKALSIMGEVRAQVELLRSDDTVIYGAVLPQYLTNATAIYRACGQFDDALDCANEAVSFFRRQNKTDAALEDLATALNNKANVLTEMKEAQSAGELHSEALAIREQLAHSGYHKHRADFAISLSAHAGLLTNTRESLENLDKARSILSTLASDHPALYASKWASFLNNECLYFIDRGHTAKGIASGLAAVNEFRRLYNDGREPNAGNMAGALCNLAIAYDAHKDFEKAIACLDEAKTIYKSLSAAGDPRASINLAKAYENLFLVNLARGNIPSALDSRRHAIETLEELQGRPDQSFADYLRRTTRRLKDIAVS